MVGLSFILCSPDEAWGSYCSAMEQYEVEYVTVTVRITITTSIERLDLWEGRAAKYETYCGADGLLYARFSVVFSYELDPNEKWLAEDMAFEEIYDIDSEAATEAIEEY